MSQQAQTGDPRVDRVLDDLVALEDDIETLQAKVDRLDELEQRVQRLEQRTDMLRLIEDSDDLDAQQRSAALVQHAIEEVRNSDRTRVAFDHGRAMEVLHYPDVDRTTIYTDMRRCERLIGDQDICWYATASESETDTTEVTFDLGAVDETVDASTLIGGGE